MRPPPEATDKTDLARLTLLLGVTGSGKTAVSLRLAESLGAEIISVDSMQVYRGMDIGTAKASPAERSRVPHHLIDVLDPWESCSVARFVEMADAAIADVTSRGRPALVVAGTPLYLMGLMFGMFEGPSADAGFRERLRARAAGEGTGALHRELAAVDAEAAARIHPNDYKRIERALEVYHATGRTLSSQQTQWAAARLRYPATVVGIRRDKEDASHRINARVKQMMEAGLLAEVTRLLRSPRGLSRQAAQAVGYAQIIDHLEGRCSLHEAVEQIKVQSRQLAKHQRTWFRKFETCKWVDVAPSEPEECIAARLLSVIRPG